MHVRGQRGLAGCVLETSAELEGQGGAHQAHAARAFWRGVVEAPVGGQGQQARRLEGHGQGLPTAAVGKARGPGAGGQQMREDHGLVLAAQEVALPATGREEGEGGLVAPAAVGSQAGEEGDQELRVWGSEEDTGCSPGQEPEVPGPAPPGKRLAAKGQRRPSGARAGFTLDSWTLELRMPIPLLRTGLGAESPRAFAEGIGRRKKAQQYL